MSRRDCVRPRTGWRLISALLLFAILSGLLLETVPAQAAPAAQEPAGSATPAVTPAVTPAATALQDCSTVAEDTLQGELNTVTQQVFAAELRTLDLDAIVDKQWVTLALDDALAAAVDRAVARVLTETDLWNKFLSAWNPDLAKELTLAVATYTFDDPTFRERMDVLGAAVSRDVADRLTLASADSVSAALYCMQTFIGRNYSKALVGAFEARVQSATSSANLVNADASPDILKMVGQHQLALGGVGVIIAAQITRKIVVSVAERISQRVAGRIVGRVLGKAGSTVIPIAGWLLGTGMIAYDLWTSRDGALPQIQESLKSEPVKAGVRSEIAASIRPELEAELPGLARTIANDLFVEWRNTKRNIRHVLDLAAANPQFAAVLATVQTPDAVARLVDLVAAVEGQGGDPALTAALTDGSLAAVANLPAGAVTLVQETGSLQTALAWHTAVGDRLDDVVALELYKHSTPATVDLAQLDRLLAVGDKTAVTRLAALKPGQADALLTLPASSLVALANLLGPDDLAWLGDVLPTLTATQANALVSRILSQPAVVPGLRRLGDLSTLASAGSLDQAITFVAGPRDTAAYWLDAASVATGEASMPLFQAKHGLWPTVGFFALLVLFGLVALRLVYSLGQWLVEPINALRRLGRR